MAGRHGPGHLEGHVLGALQSKGAIINLIHIYKYMKSKLYMDKTGGGEYQTKLIHVFYMYVKKKAVL